MAILGILCGIILVLAGISFMATPLATYLATGYIFAIMLLVVGIVGIVNFINKKTSALSFVTSILAVIVGLVCVFRPGKTLVFDGIGLILIAVWLIVGGLVHVVTAIQSRGYNSGWFWSVLAGVLAVAAGILSFYNPVVTALTAGTIIGILFVIVGVNMIVAGASAGAE